MSLPNSRVKWRRWWLILSTTRTHHLEESISHVLKLTLSSHHTSGRARPGWISSLLRKNWHILLMCGIRMQWLSVEMWRGLRRINLGRVFFGTGLMHLYCNFANTLHHVTYSFVVNKGTMSYKHRRPKPLESPLSFLPPAFHFSPGGILSVTINLYTFLAVNYSPLPHHISWVEAGAQDALFPHLQQRGLAICLKRWRILGSQQIVIVSCLRTLQHSFSPSPTNGQEHWWLLVA